MKRNRLAALGAVAVGEVAEVVVATRARCIATREILVKHRIAGRLLDDRGLREFYEVVDHGGVRLLIAWSVQ